MGVATGCGCKEVYRFPNTTYPYSSCISSFLQQHPYFLFFFKNVFRSLLRAKRAFWSVQCTDFLYISRTSCHKCSKCFYVYLNIRPVRYSARIESVANARRQQLRTARQLRTAQSPKERDASLQQLRTAREQTIATESTEERQTRLQQLRSAQQQRIAAETPEEIEARLQQLSTAQQQDCCQIDRGERGPASTDCRSVTEGKRRPSSTSYNCSLTDDCNRID